MPKARHHLPRLTFLVINEHTHQRLQFLWRTVQRQ